MRTFAKIKQLFQTDKPESGSRKPESAGYDVPMFLSDVYNRCTQAKKQPADCCLSGRSMVEMIGVLAIIGVLSVGAIAGYSAAMNKYRMNKTIALFNQILQNTIELSGKTIPRTYTSSMWRQLGIISEADCPLNFQSVTIPANSHMMCPLPLKGAEFNMSLESGHEVYPYNNSLGIAANISIRFYGSRPRSRDNCISFLSHHWEKIIPPEWWGNYGTIGIAGKGAAGANVYLFRGAPKKEITLEAISEACNFCIIGDNKNFDCIISFGIG